MTDVISLPDGDRGTYFISREKLMLLPSITNRFAFAEELIQERSRALGYIVMFECSYTMNPDGILIRWWPQAREEFSMKHAKELHPFQKPRNKVLRELVMDPKRYGLITYRPDGSVCRVDIAFEHPHKTFISSGWKFYPGAGYFDTHGNIAEAYQKGELILYPEWYKGE